MMASGRLREASRRPISPFMAVRTSKPSSRSMRAKVVRHALVVVDDEDRWPYLARRRGPAYLLL